jgi:hypothetical protein
MALREELQRLVDTLPEGALEAARSTLARFQTWPPQPAQPPPQVERMRREHMERMRASMRPGTCGGGGGGGSYTVGQGGNIDYGSFSFTHWEDKTAVFETHRFHGGHELVMTDRLQLGDDGKALIYVHEVVGPKAKTNRYEISFDVG